MKYIIALHFTNGMIYEQLLLRYPACLLTKSVMLLCHIVDGTE